MWTIAETEQDIQLQAPHREIAMTNLRNESNGERMVECASFVLFLDRIRHRLLPNPVASGFVFVDKDYREGIHASKCCSPKELSSSPCRLRVRSHLRKLGILSLVSFLTIYRHGYSVFRIQPLKMARFFGFTDRFLIYSCIGHRVQEWCEVAPVRWSSLS